MKNKRYYDKPNFKLYLGDSFELLSQFKKESFDMIFADPPYGLSNGGFTVHAGRRVSVNKGNWDKSRGVNGDYEFHLEWITKCKDLLKPNGTIWISGTYHSIYACGFALQKAGYHILNDISWYKPNASPNLSCRYFTASHETLIWARKDKKAKHYFNYEVMRDWQNNYKVYSKQNDPVEAIHKRGKQMRSVWAILTPKKEEKRFSKHPTQKPIELLKRVVLASTKKGDKILDPFTGSSTTGLAAYLFGREFVGIDNEKEYLDLSIKRFNELKNNLKRKQTVLFSKKSVSSSKQNQLQI